MDSNTSIDWVRIAEPQADEYDTEVVLAMAASTVSAARPQPYRRIPVGNAVSVFDGQVAVRPVYRNLPEFKLIEGFPDAPFDHPNIRQAAEHVRRWPRAYRQCQRLLEAIHPALDPSNPIEARGIYRGSVCHSLEALFGTLWSTVFCPLGLAEAIVHEMAHQKLRVLGVSFESATAIVGNDPELLYVSPVIKDRLRPMTAVLHAQYSYTYVTALDVELLRTERSSAGRVALAEVLRRNLGRIEEGYQTLRHEFRAGPHGEEFIAGLYAWNEHIITAARQLLDEPKTSDRSGRNPNTPGADPATRLAATPP